MDVDMDVAASQDGGAAAGRRRISAGIGSGSAMTVATALLTKPDSRATVLSQTGEMMDGGSTVASAAPSDASNTLHDGHGVRERNQHAQDYRIDELVIPHDLASAGATMLRDGSHRPTRTAVAALKRVVQDLAAGPPGYVAALAAARTTLALAPHLTQANGQVGIMSYLAIVSASSSR